MTLHINSTGYGPDLILLHGWAMHSGIFAPLLPMLESHFRVHRVDLPGHGQSRTSAMALDFEPVWQTILARLDKPAYVMGWSLGGLFALHGALQYSDACKGLVMQNASPCFVERPNWPLGMPASVFQHFAAELSSDYGQTLQRFFMLEAQGAEHVRRDLQCLQKTAFEYGEPDAAVLQQGLHLLENIDLRANLAKLSVPSLWLAGRRDRLVNPKAMQTAAEQAHGQFLCDEHGGHAPFLSHPESVANAVIAFSQEHP